MHAQRERFSAANCPIARALEVLGERWTILVLREAFYGVRRFDDFQRLVGCARNVLAARLATLVEYGVLETAPYREPGRRTRNEYRLTERGRELQTVVVALMAWGDRHLGNGPPPVLLRHRDCGAEIVAELRCGSGHGPLAARDVVATPGPGAQPAVQPPSSAKAV